MGIFSKSKDKGELALLFDIESSSVGGVLFYINKSKVPEIVFSFREQIVTETEFNFDRFFTGTMKALGDVAGKICLAGLGSPKHFFCVLSSPWYASQTRVIRVEKNTPFTFTNKLADSLTKKEISFFQEEHLYKYDQDGSKALPIEFKNMKTVLNGYTATNPINQRATELEMTVFISISSEHFLQRVQEIVSQHFFRKDIKFLSLAMVSFAVARDLFVKQENFLLIDIGGEITDISMVKKDVLSNSISFPKGLNFITRGIASILNCSLDEAKSLISLYKDEHAETLTEKRLEPMISKLKNEWLNEFQNSLANLSNDISIPANIFITIDSNFAPFFSDIIKTEQFSQYTLTESKFKVVFLDTEKLYDAALLGSEVKLDPLVILGAIYINRFIR
ncbi:MAG: hypothetical protein Q8O46_04640 [bacterium]|nr:hypothetical protein [bacterium]